MKEVAGFERMAGEKFLRREALAAFTLKYKNPQRALTAGDDDSGFVGV